jgi:vacuolar-type H+-ATPase subunit H
MLSSKHLATFILGAAAGAAALKYMSLSDEEKEKLIADLKKKAHGFKEDAENTAQKAKEYFEELRTKGGEALKEHMGDADKFMSDLFGKKTGPANPTANT